jgi:predicted metal-dependent phosphotriesterase family hydrolase
VDLTTSGMRRDPLGVRRISATGVQVVMGCGWYRQPYYPEERLAAGGAQRSPDPNALNSTHLKLG